jgi:hypothetical protein
MMAQRLLEGQAYVIMSLVPYMVYKIRKALLQSIESPNSSMYIRSFATEMMQVFNKNFGQGQDGTAATENLDLGDQGHPKGINILALMASLLDPRMKGGVGASEQDKDLMYESIGPTIVGIATEDIYIYIYIDIYLF